MKFEVILNLPPPSTLRQLQSLQGKEIFLRRFIPNYDELMKGFTRLLKNCYNFVWDDTANKAFEALKLALTHTSLLFPPDYSRDYSHDEHVIYYLSLSLTTTKTRYLHVEKLALEIIQVVQRFRH
jgi:hypothetical protein